jgi:hypothetical protein
MTTAATEPRAKARQRPGELLWVLVCVGVVLLIVTFPTNNVSCIDDGCDVYIWG